MEINELLKKIKDIGGILNIEAKKKSLAELQKQTSDPNLWSNAEKAKKLMQETKYLEKQIETWESLRAGTEDLKTLAEMATDKELPEIEEELKTLKKEAEKLEVTALLSGPYDKNNAILSISAGAGGTDAQDWAQILLRMFTRWAEAKEYKVEMVDMSYGEGAGIKGVTLVINGPFAYGYLKNENGIHRLVRISPFSSEGKRHTSFASIEVIPETADNVKIEIEPKDLRIDTYRASGPGGQNVNKVSSAVRITHVPTNIVTQSQADRSQHINRDNAMRLLKSRLYEMMMEQHKEKIEELRGEKKKNEWGSQIRSYVFQPYTMVKDHRTKAENTNVQAVIDGDLDVFIEAMLRQGKK